MAAAKRNLVSAFVSTLLLCVPTALWGADTPDPATVTIAGSLQSELGCPGDWQPECTATHLAFDAGDGVWQGTFNLPAGSYEYKAALNDTWDESYGANAQPGGANIPLALGVPTDVKFYYDHESHWVTDSANSVIATVPGSFQSALGCPGDWQPDCLRSWLQDPDGDGIYGFTTDAIPAGDYEAKVAHDEAWDESYGQGGTPGGANIPFTVGTGETVTFTYDPGTHILTIGTAPPPPTAQFDYSIIHYLRPAGDYGTPSADFNTFWGLHLWGDAIDPSEATDWTQPKPFEGQDEFGRFAWMRRGNTGSQVNFIIHRGDTKDTDPDRSFDADAHPEVWIHQGDTTIYTSQAEAQAFVTVHYHRADGEYGAPSPDFNTFWGLHLWGDAINPSEATQWTAPKPPTGIDGYGAFWEVQIVDASQPVNFILHRGDTKDPANSPDRSFAPLEMATIWLQSEDVTVYPQRGAAQGFATLHYHRDDGDYGDPTSPNFNDFWGMHVWDGAAAPNPSWQDPVRPAGRDVFGPYFQIDLVPAATELAYILHRGDTKDPGPDQFLDLGTYGYEVWQLSGDNPSDPAQPHYVLPTMAAAPPPPPLPGDLDGDGDVDRDDLNILLAARNTPASGPDDPRDLDGDGMITVLDGRQLVLLCTRDRCATE